MVQNAVKWIPFRGTRGRKPNATPVVKRGIIRYVKKNSFISSKQIQNDLNINVYSTTIRKTLIKEPIVLEKYQCRRRTYNKG